jgi:hypothetical protein
VPLSATRRFRADAAFAAAASISRRRPGRISRRSSHGARDDDDAADESGAICRSEIIGEPVGGEDEADYFRS